jgi:Lrp/AsnC family transcriptional regulator, leucine-responsive regulatory protein
MGPMSSSTAGAGAPRAVSLDVIDERLLTELRANARVSNAALGRIVGLTPPAVVERLRRLEAAGVITGYHAAIDREAVGFGLTVFLSISLQHHGAAAVDAFTDAMQGVDEVVERHQVTGRPDFFVKVVARDVEHYKAVLMTRLSDVPGIERVESHVVLQTYKDDDLPVAR